MNNMHFQQTRIVGVLSLNPVIEFGCAYDDSKSNHYDKGNDKNQ